MKKNLKLILLFVALVVLSILAYFMTQNSDSVLSEDALTDFAVEDTSTIDQLKLSNTSNQEVTLVKKHGEWQTSKGVVVDQKPVQTMLKTIKRIQVKSPVPKSAMETVMNQIIGNHVKVDIFQNGKLVKSYYVGHPTADHYGTYMLLEKPDEGRSPEPFIMYLPGHNGHLTTRFFADPKDWKFSGIFNLDPINIQKVTVTNHEKPGETFTINAVDDKNFELLNQFQKKVFDFDTVKVRKYLTAYRKIHYDFVEKSLTESMKDSILNSQPFRTITLTKKNGDSKLIDCYKRPARNEEYDMNDQLITEDRDLFIGHINRKELVVCQYYVFDKLFFNLSDFLKNKRP